jgi:hypothetical protein
VRAAAIAAALPKRHLVYRWTRIATGRAAIHFIDAVDDQSIEAMAVRQ